MAALIEHLEGTFFSENISVAAMIGAIESYSQSSKGMWLKVAGGDKAEVLAATMNGWRLQCGEVGVEYGLFVGYTAMRLAFYNRPRRRDESASGRAPRILSLELDPIHACVARHVVNLASLSTSQETLIGQAKDTVPAISEMCGESGAGFFFMDQRGTLFHEDLGHLEHLRLNTPTARVTADNVVKPGAPVFLWHLGQCGDYDVTPWSMSEFQTEPVEDYVVVATPRTARGRAPMASVAESFRASAARLAAGSGGEVGACDQGP